MKSLFSLEQYTKIFPRLKRKLSESSQFGKKLIEYRKLRTIYGKPSQRYLEALYKKSDCPSQTSFSFFRVLESRLDVVLYRAHFFESIASAKQQVRIGKIEVNNKKVISPGYNVIPGDIVRVISEYNEKGQASQNPVVFNTSSNEHFFLSKKSKKKNGSRFQRSPFFVSLVASQFKKAMTLYPLCADNKITEFKIKAIEKSFLYRLSKLSFKEFSMSNLVKTWCFQNTFLFGILSHLRQFSTKKGIKQNLIAQAQKSQEKFGTTTLSSLQDLQPQNQIEYHGKSSVCNKNKSFTNDFNNDFLSLFEKIKKDDSFVISKSLTSYEKSQLEEKSLRERMSFDKRLSENSCFLESNKKPIEIKNWLFSNFVLFLKKHAISTKKKSFCFFLQKTQPFFKSQSFFVAKKIKPLHLEISYRSRSIIFLFPPQRVSFPTFIDLSQIYK